MSKPEKINYFDRERITRHEKLQRAKELYIDFLEQDHHTKFGSFSPAANKFILETFQKYHPKELAAFRKYVGIRKKSVTKTKKPASGRKKSNQNLHAFAQLGVRFESKVKEVLLMINQHKAIDFQVSIPVKGHDSNTHFLRPDIVINDDIWIDCKLSIDSNIKETALKYEGHCRLLEFYLLIDDDIEYGVHEESGQIVRSIWNVIERGRRRLGEELTEHYRKEFNQLKEEYLMLKGETTANETSR
ncbi:MULTISPECIES: hypothetical protein [Pontibacillus]|uniref:Uncharacterized protein n=1 Tax=Pontibacillus chungwhensis TaxID=265426 RepID=A0ABY8V1I8_9BACI|nr:MULTISPECIES: hypothetical protein [Pontibacillus]MCD5324207.1 hypothetical protein [Pontibacillus sp. HN14]WIF97736.1 hypothetical protein QNI29_18725 [Pontibacillus chungwhensis]